MRPGVDPDDGRGFHASLTPAGYEKLAQARAPHDAVIQRQVGDRLTREELDFLEAILAKLLTDSDP